MSDQERFNPSTESKRHRLIEQLWIWLQGDDPDDQYLAAATDVADLERRMRLLERASGGPVFPTRSRAWRARGPSWMRQKRSAEPKKRDATS
ncbi:MAG TPA: DUF3563 family protein [Casimicrobiaceae bacterium]